MQAQVEFLCHMFVGAGSKLQVAVTFLTVGTWKMVVTCPLTQWLLGHMSVTSQMVQYDITMWADWISAGIMFTFHLFIAGKDMYNTVQAYKNRYSWSQENKVPVHLDRVKYLETAEHCFTSFLQYCSLERDRTFVNLLSDLNVAMNCQLSLTQSI